MLYSIKSGQYIDYIPHEDDFRTWRGRLTDEEFEAIVGELNERISGDEIHTSNWIPGNDWSGTVYDPIYRRACLEDPNTSDLCFGLFLWVVVQNHPQVWSFGRYEKDGVPISGITYFRLRTPPPR